MPHEVPHEVLAHVGDGDHSTCVSRLSEFRLTMQCWCARGLLILVPLATYNCKCKVGMLDEWLGEWMPDEAKYQIETVEEIKKCAIETDVTTDDGFCRLRNALIMLTSVDGYWIKGKGTSHDPKRLLPSLDVIVGIDGVHGNALCSLYGYGEGKMTSGRADSYFLMRELGRALVDGEAYFGYAKREIALIVKRYIARSCFGPLDAETEEYVSRKSPDSDATWIVTLDFSFTAAGLQAFVVLVCDSYLSSR